MLNDIKIDMGIQETRKRVVYGYYLVVYSELDKDKRVKEGVALAIHKNSKIT